MINVLSGNAGPGYNDDMSARYHAPSQLMNPGSLSPFDAGQLTQQDHHQLHQFQSNTYDNRAGLALGLHQSSPSFQSSNSHADLNPFEDWSSTREKGDDFLSEEEIRLKSHEMLENEDMQHLLRIFSMGGHSVTAPDDAFAFPPYVPSPSPGFSYTEDRARPGKAVVGWLKIKAAMRWGIFIRKKAAERRAHLVEIEDE